MCNWRTLFPSVRSTPFIFGDIRSAISPRDRKCCEPILGTEGQNNVIRSSFPCIPRRGRWAVGTSVTTESAMLTATAACSVWRSCHKSIVSSPSLPLATPVVHDILTDYSVSVVYAEERKCRVHGTPVKICFRGPFSSTLSTAMLMLMLTMLRWRRKCLMWRSVTLAQLQLLCVIDLIRRAAYAER